MNITSEMPRGTTGRRVRRRVSPTGVALLLVGCALLPVPTFVGVQTYVNSIKPAGIIIHHAGRTLTDDGRPLNVGTIAAAHRDRGFGIRYWGRKYYVGYHYIILPDGTVQAGRPEGCQGAHAVGYNSYLGVCLIGDYSTKDNPEGEYGLQRPTTAQMRALVALCRRLQENHHIPAQKILRHSETNPGTECPGDRFPMADLLGPLEAPAQAANAEH